MTGDAGGKNGQGHGDGNGGGQGNNGSRGGPPDDDGAPELIIFPGSKRPEQINRLDHLRTHRRLIVRRSLLASVVGGAVPIPVVDEYVSGRVRAGMLMNLAERRQVDLAQSSADLLADPREGTTVRNATLTAATLLAVKLAGKKIFALLAVGRGAEDMATSFQMGTLFDHFCAKLHTGSGLDRPRAIQLRAVMQGTLAETERAAVVAIFRDGGRTLGRSMLEAPAWISARFQKAAEQWMRSGGQPNVALDDDDNPAVAADEARWLDRASRTVEEGLGRLSTNYLETLIGVFERRWQDAERDVQERAKEKAKEKPDETAAKGPPVPPSAPTR